MLLCRINYKERCFILTLQTYNGFVDISKLLNNFNIILTFIFRNYLIFRHNL